MKILFSKKVKYSILAASFLLLILSVLFYISRVNIYEPFKIKVKQGESYITNGIQLKAIQPLSGSFAIDADSSGKCWNIVDGYYNKILFNFESFPKGTKALPCSIEIYSGNGSALITSFQLTTIPNNSFEISTIHNRNFLQILKKLFFVNYTFFVFLITFAVSLLCVLLIRKLKILGFFSLLFPVVIIIWSFSCLILASLFTVPNGEDFENILRNNGAFKILLNCDDRYFTNFLHGFNPLAWGYLSFYKFIPIISLVLVTLSLYFFIQTIFRNFIQKRSAFLIASFFVVYHYLTIPSMVNDLYFMTSSFVYLYSWICFFLWTGFFVRLLQSDNAKSKLLYFITSSFIMVCCYGTSEMMLILIPFSLLVFSFIIFKYLPANKHFVISLIFIAIACSIYILSRAPVEMNRSEHFERNFQFFQHIFFVGSKEFFATIFDWSFHKIFTIPLIISATLLINMLNKKEVLKRISLKHLAFLLTGLCLTLFALPFIYYITAGAETYPARVFNFTNWIFIFIILVIIPLMLVKSNIPGKILLKTNHYRVLAFIFIFAFLQILLTDNNMSLIVNEYQKGILSDYNKEMNERYSVIRNQKSSSGWVCAEIDSLKAKPKAIFGSSEISPNRTSVDVNKGYEGFFMLDEIRMKGDTLSKLKLIQNYAKK